MRWRGSFGEDTSEANPLSTLVIESSSAQSVKVEDGSRGSNETESRNRLSVGKHEFLYPDLLSLSPHLSTFLLKFVLFFCCSDVFVEE